MKKLVLSGLLLSMMGNASAINGLLALLQRPNPNKPSEYEFIPMGYPLAYLGGAIGVSYALTRLAKMVYSSENNLTFEVSQLPQIDQQAMPVKFNWANQLAMDNSTKLLLAGIGLTGLSVYAGLKESQLKNKNTKVKANNSGLFGFAMNIDFGSIYTLAPLIPAYFCFKYGFEKLNK